MMIKEAYHIDLELLEKLAEGDYYWRQSYKFYCEICDKSVDWLTDRQADRLYKMEKNLQEAG